MTKLAILILTLLPLTAHAKDSKTTVSGMRADYMLSFGTDLDAAGGAGGQVLMKLTDIVCTKVVANDTGSVTCTFNSPDLEGAQKTVSSVEAPNSSAQNMRMALIELSKGAAEKKINASTRVTTAKSISCSGPNQYQDLSFANGDFTRTCVVVW